MNSAGYTFSPPTGYGTRKGSPFGLGSGLGGLFGQANVAGSYMPRPVITPPPRQPAYRPPSGALLGTLYRNSISSGANTAPTPGKVSFNLGEDPALQQAQALIGMSNEQATAAAQKELRDSLLAYGDPNLITKVLGGGSSDLAKAAAANPTSTTAQLRTQRDRNLKNLDEQLNQANLSYGGYRVNQESQAAQDYQNALAQAAAAEQGQIGSIQSYLAQALAANNQSYAQAYNDAANALIGQGINPATGQPLGGGTASGAWNPQTYYGSI